MNTHMLCVFLVCMECVTAKEKGAYDHVVVNDDVDVAYEKLKGILIKVGLAQHNVVPL